jgi:hypothetical protein
MSKKAAGVQYDPKFGFDLDIKGIANPEGTYVCTAIDKGVRKTVEYNVKYPYPSSSSRPGSGSPGSPSSKRSQL